MARPEGFEPPTDRFEADYSIQLSYERIRHKKSLTHNMQGFLIYGSPGRARTADLMINSHPLYRLSYRGIILGSMARPERFELPTDRFVADYSIQLSYGRLIEPLIIFFFSVLVNLYLNRLTFLIWRRERGSNPRWEIKPILP